MKKKLLLLLGLVFTLTVYSAATRTLNFETWTTLLSNQDLTITPSGTGVVNVGSDILMTGTGQIDVPVGTTAQRSGSPNSGMFRFNSDTTTFEGYNGSAWGSIGGGGGGLDVFYDEDHEQGTDSSDYTSGQNATFDNGGTLGGALANETGSPIAGDTSVKYTTNATPGSSDNDWIASASITLDDKQKSNWIGLNFFYTWDGSDDLLCVVVWDDTNNAVLNDATDCLETNSIATRYSLGVYIPSTTNALKIGFHHTGTSEASKVLVFDDIELSSNPFVYKDLLEESSIFLRQDNGSMTDVVGEPRWDLSTATQKSFGTGLTAEDDAANNRTKFTVNKDGVIDVTFAARKQANTTNSFLSVVHYNSAGTELATYDGMSTVESGATLATRAVFEVSATDFVTVEITGNDLSVSAGVDHAVSLNLRSKKEHVVTPATSTLTDWQSYTPTTQGLGSVTFNNALWRRVGDSYELLFNFTTGTVTASEAQISLPNSKAVSSELGSIQVVGDAVRADSTAIDLTVLATSGDTFLNFSFRSASGDSDTPQTGSALFISSTPYQVYAKVPINGLSSSATFLAAIPVPLTAYVEDQKTASTAGGTFTSGAWQTRDLNTIDGDSSFITLSSNEFTLEPGVYYIEWDAPAYDVGIHQSRLYDVTASASLKRGTQMDTEVSANVHNVSSGNTKVTLSTSNTYRIEHRCTTTKATSGYGVADTFSEGALFTRVKVTKIK